MRLINSGLLSVVPFLEVDLKFQICFLIISVISKCVTVPVRKTENTVRVRLYDNPDPSDPGSGIWDPDLESIRVVNTLNFEQQQQATLTSDLIYDFTFKEE